MSKLALLFSGQGSQINNMGREFAEASKDAMQLWLRAEKVSTLPLRAIYWEGNEADMANTKALQPALTVVNINTWLFFESKCKPAATAGHSLGEFSSLFAAHVLSVEEVIQLTSLRGQLMAEADPHKNGAMAAILKLDLATLEDIVQKVITSTSKNLIIANYNTPAQLVISGDKIAVDAALVLTKEHKGKGIMLNVSGAFHSPLMNEAAHELSIALQKVTWKDAHFPIYSNIDGLAHTNAHDIKENMLKQMTSSVQWIKTMRQAWKDDICTFVEVGPKAILGKMIQPCLKELNVKSEDINIKFINSLQTASTFVQE